VRHKMRSEQASDVVISAVLLKGDGDGAPVSQPTLPIVVVKAAESPKTTIPLLTDEEEIMAQKYRKM
jgi:hypothetical protein